MFCSHPWRVHSPSSPSANHTDFFYLNFFVHHQAVQTGNMSKHHQRNSLEGEFRLISGAPIATRVWLWLTLTWLDVWRSADGHMAVNEPEMWCINGASGVDQLEPAWLRGPCLECEAGRRVFRADVGLDALDESSNPNTWWFYFKILYWPMQGCQS